MPTPTSMSILEKLGKVNDPRPSPPPSRPECHFFVFLPFAWSPIGNGTRHDVVNLSDLRVFGFLGRLVARDFGEGLFSCPVVVLTPLPEFRVLPFTSLINDATFTSLIND